MYIGPLGSTFKCPDLRALTSPHKRLHMQQIQEVQRLTSPWQHHRALIINPGAVPEAAK